MKTDIEQLLEIADAGSVRQYVWATENIGITKINFTINGGAVSCQYSCGLTKLHGITIEGGIHDLAKMVGKAVE